MKRRQKYQVIVNVYTESWTASQIIVLGETWANNEREAIKNLEYKFRYAPDRMLFVVYSAEVVQ